MKPGRVIFLNGASSSGKSSILRTLQDRLEPPYLDMGLDRFIFMLPRRYLDRPLWHDVLGEADYAGATGHALVSGMHHAIRSAVHVGLNVVADHVLIEKAWVDQCVELFADLPAYLVGVLCPLEILEERERQRKDRTLGQARKQFPILHKGIRYDLEVDSSLLNAAECAEKIIERLASPPIALKRMKPG